jgi:flagellar hook-length control protein FliK
VRLEHAVETVQAMLRVAAERGATRARLQLHPAELGAIEVRLHSTAEGLRAHIVADAAQAAALLGQAGDDLRRSLEQQGVNVLHLDVGTSGQENGGAGSAGEEAGSRSGSGSAGSGPAEEGGPDGSEDVRVQLPNGVLVDVLA